MSTQCKLYTVTPNDSLHFERNIAEVNESIYQNFHHCLSFAPRDDGTAYLSARNEYSHGAAQVWVVNLETGIVSEPMEIVYPAGSLPWDSTSGDNQSDLEPNDFALNPVDGSLWVVGYWGYLYRLVGDSNGKWHPQDFWVSDPTNDQIVPVSITFDSNGVLWSSFYNWTDESRNYLYALSKDDQEIWSAVQIGAFSFESVETTVDVLWFETTVTSEREFMTRELANTGSGSLLWWTASGSTLIVGIVALAATMTRNRSRCSARITVK